jgi:hypothetical protein
VPCKQQGTGSQSGAAAEFGGGGNPVDRRWRKNSREVGEELGRRAQVGVGCRDGTYDQLDRTAQKRVLGEQSSIQALFSIWVSLLMTALYVVFDDYVFCSSVSKCTYFLFVSCC